MSLIDFTHRIDNNIPVFPGDNPPELIPVVLKGENGYRETSFRITSHTGTHIDAPSHMIPGGKMLDDFPIDKFTGPGITVDLSGKWFSGVRGSLEITKDDLAPLFSRIDNIDFVLIHTGWSNYWGKSEYTDKIPYLSAEAALFLAEHRLKGVGIDTISIDRIDSPVFSNHAVFLSRDIIVIENLTNLDKAPDELFTFFCMPLYYKDADGSPTRAFGLN